MKRITFEELHEFLEESLSNISKQFRDNNIIWWAHAGTALGVMRHKGLIPWDDDIDMGMSISHYWDNKDKIEKIAEDNGWSLRDKYDRKYKALDVTRLIYKEQFIVTYEGREYKFRPFIEIMLGTTVNKESKFMAKWWKVENKLLHMYMGLPYRFKSTEGDNPRPSLLLRTVYTLGTKLVRFTLLPVWLVKGQQYLRVKYVEKKYKDTDTCALHYAFLQAKRNVFMSKTDIKYVEGNKGRMFPVQRDVERLLTSYYGDWKQLPKEENRKPAHMFLYEDDPVIQDPFFIN